MINNEIKDESVANVGTNIHPSAVIAKSARIGENVTIGPYCVIGDEVEIGDGSKVAEFFNSRRSVQSRRI